MGEAYVGFYGGAMVDLANQMGTYRKSGVCAAHKVPWLMIYLVPSEVIRGSC
jgi:hypothetical protein